MLLLRWCLLPRRRWRLSAHGTPCGGASVNLCRSLSPPVLLASRHFSLGLFSPSHPPLSLRPGSVLHLGPTVGFLATGGVVLFWFQLLLYTPHICVFPSFILHSVWYMAFLVLCSFLRCFAPLLAVYTSLHCSLLPYIVSTLSVALSFSRSETRKCCSLLSCPCTVPAILLPLPVCLFCLFCGLWA